MERRRALARAASGTAAATWRTVLFARGTTLTAPCVSPLVVMEIGFVSVQTSVILIRRLWESQI